MILWRWLHVISACLLVGAAFLVYAIVPWALLDLETQARESALLRLRRGFKMLVHVCSLLLLISGTYNAIGNWRAYGRNIPLTHALFGPHLLLGLVIFALLVVMLARRVPRPSDRTWLGATVALLFITVAIASALKYAREHPKAVQQTTSYSSG